MGRFLPTGLPAPLGGGPSAAERGDPQGVAKRPGPGGGRTAAEAARRARDRELPCLCGLRTGMATGLPGMQKALPWLWGKAPPAPGPTSGKPYAAKRKRAPHEAPRGGRAGTDDAGTVAGPMPDGVPGDRRGPEGHGDCTMLLRVCAEGDPGPPESGELAGAAAAGAGPALRTLRPPWGRRVC